MGYGDFTQLEGFQLYYDGDIVVEPDKVEEFLYKNIIPYVSHITPDIKKFNSLVEDISILEKKDTRELSYKWNIPNEYLELDVYQYIMGKLSEQIIHDGPLLRGIKQTRVEVEYHHFETHKLLDLLRTLIYIINRFDQTNTVWGIGRGSSVSSYILFLIGVHDIDSVKYDLDMSDFFRE